MSTEFVMSEKIMELYALTQELESQYPGRKFTPDGHMVGSIGEVLAAEAYGLTLEKPSYPIHDAHTADGRKVQIKATQIDRIAIAEKPEYLLVLRILPDGTWEEIYNGPGDIPWKYITKPTKTGQHFLSLTLLRKLQESIPSNQRISLIQR